jgi:hypothetical protein
MSGVSAVKSIASTKMIVLTRRSRRRTFFEHTHAL